MSTKPWLLICLGFAMLTSCVARPRGAGLTPTNSIPRNQKTTVATPDATPFPTASEISEAILSPIQSEQAIRGKLISGEDCMSPCFLGIAPRETTVEEAERKMTYLGFPLSYRGPGQSGDTYTSFIAGKTIPVISLELLASSNLINILYATIDDQPLLKEDWLAYSPEEVLKKYGPPERVELLLNSNPEAQRDPGYTLALYYDEMKLIFYYYYALFQDPTSAEACPTRDEFQMVALWYGDMSEFPQARGLPLGQAASLTDEEFFDALVNQNACFNINVKAFSP